MKTKLAAILAVLAAAAFAAAVIQGEYNTACGNQAGFEASGSRVTAFGVQAAAMSSGNEAVALMGLCAGLYSANLSSCVGIGAKPLRNAQYDTDCIAIGKWALADSYNCYECVFIGNQYDEMATPMRNRSNVTWINGQIIAQPGRLAIHDQPLTEYDESVDEATHDWKYYDDGARPPTIDLETIETNGEYRTRLTLRADDVRMEAGTLDGRMFTNTSVVVYMAGGRVATNAAEVVSSSVGLSGNEYFVSAHTGSDSNDGLSIATAKKSIDAGFALAANAGDTVILLAGRYPWPEFYRNTEGAGHWLNVVGIGGAENVVIDAALNSDQRQAVLRSAYSGTMSSFKGVTFRGGVLPVSGESLYAQYVGCYAMCEFTDCVFEGMDGRVFTGRTPWNTCILNGCRVRDCRFDVAGSAHSSKAVFLSADVFDSIVEMETEGNIVLASAAHFENSYVRCGTVARLFGLSGGASSMSVLGNQQEFLDCTLVATNDTAEAGQGALRGCLAGIGETAPPANINAAEGTVLTNAPAVSAALMPDFRPAERNLGMYFLGYNSRHDRCIRDASVRAVLDAITNVTGAVVFSGTAYTLMSATGGDAARLDAQARLEAALFAHTNGVRIAEHEE